MNFKVLYITILLALCPLFVFQTANAGDHEKVFGIGGGFISRNTSAEGGLFFQYGFSHVVRAELDASLAFRNKHRDAMLIDLNAQFPFHTSARCEIYPLAGLNYSSWSYHEPAVAKAEGDNGVDVTTRHGYFGLNAGAGFGCRVTPTLKLKAEAMFTAVKSNSGARVLIGIGYSF